MLSLSTISAFEAVASSGIKFREARISGCLRRFSAEKPLFYGGELKIHDLAPLQWGSLIGRVIPPAWGLLTGRHPGQHPGQRPWGLSH